MLYQQVLFRIARVPLTVGIAALGALVATVEPAAAQDPYVEQVRAQLNQAASTFSSDGYRSTHEPFIDAIGAGVEDSITITLREGMTYVIIGVCDQDCRDLDLRVYDDSGNLIASDLANDDFPVVQVTPRWDARFTLRPYMANCSSPPCRYGIGAFGRATSSKNQPTLPAKLPAPVWGLEPAIAKS